MAGKWSNGATKALRRVEKNRKKDLRDALKEIDDAPGDGKCAGRNAAVKARIHIELWRNGFEAGAALDTARSFAQAARRADPDDFYTNWKTAYAMKYRARSCGWDEMIEALAYYARALAALRANEPGNVDALRCVLFDRAETFVYLSQPDVALAEMGHAPAGPEQDWQHWALAFAQHQNGDYGAAIATIEALLTAKPGNDLYYNDMRLLLAASQARAGALDDAQRTIRDFRRNRDQQSEEVWTIALELERGAFFPGGPGETHWRASLELLDPQALPR